MKVLVAGATGAIGRQLVPLLAAAGHDVTGTARSVPGPGTPGAGTVHLRAVDALDRAAVFAVVRETAPDAVVHMLTAIPQTLHPRRLVAGLAQTNRLRTEATRHLLDAAAENGVRRVIVQGLAYAYDPAPSGTAGEDELLWQNPPKQFAPAVAALTELERRTRQADGIVLRLGHLYGPGTIYAPDGSFTAAVRARKVPLVGAGASVFSFTHVHDAATAVLVALGTEYVGPLNIVDDDPAPIGTWLPVLAGLLDAPSPRRVPTWLARIVLGGWGTAFMTRLRGADNTRARLTLDWQPRVGSWRDGFADELSGAPAVRT
jgi:nucleoside-diphosphate-sugar epimerase